MLAIYVYLALLSIFINVPYIPYLCIIALKTVSVKFSGTSSFYSILLNCIEDDLRYF